MKKSNKYDSKIVEIKIYKYWLKNNFFLSSCNKKKKSYSIIMPPPNVTGILHVGHMLNNTIQDILIRKSRMEGRETC
jgi:valyl-tRNA synthetase|tara:strand:- start:654 stop:884 length:231 start_codon:yes stop_codon:yes gene_type:complete